MMNKISGIGKGDRKKLSAIFREMKGTISVQDAANILETTSTDAAKMLSRWASKSWLSRVRRGLYVRMPLESYTTDIPLEDSWIIADRLFSPCYIGGWSAAEYWDLTEQIFRTIIVLTTKKPRNRSPIIKGTEFMLRTISGTALFGIKPVWRGQIKVSISDPSRTIIDLLNDPKLGGGIRPTKDIFSNYLKSDEKNIDLMIDYAKRLGNGAVFKRLGFLLERLAPDQIQSIQICRDNLTKGIAKLDPSLDSEKMLTRWKLWLPTNWDKEI
jgi:predicted transcriptional regulator of viral defense system